MMAPDTRAPVKIIAHRGACGLLPEHTLESYSLAIESGADAIELDLVATQDHQLIARHDVDLSLTTNVADIPEFAGRRASRIIDGINLTGWFAHDFTLAEIARLRARERFDFRSSLCNDRFSIPSLAQVIELINVYRSQGRPVELYLELKNPTYHQQLGIPLEKPLVHMLREYSLDGQSGGVCVESFEPAILQQLRKALGVRIAQLVGDLPPLSTGLTKSALRNIARYADCIGVWKRLIVPAQFVAPDPADESQQPLAVATTLIADATEAGLETEAWTFRNEPRFLAADYHGNPLAEYRHYFNLGVRGLISDFPATAVEARDGWQASPEADA